MSDKDTPHSRLTTAAVLMPNSRFRQRDRRSRAVRAWRAAVVVVVLFIILIGLHSIIA